MIPMTTSSIMFDAVIQGISSNLSALSIPNKPSGGYAMIRDVELIDGVLLRISWIDQEKCSWILFTTKLDQGGSSVLRSNFGHTNYFNISENGIFNKIASEIAMQLIKIMVITTQQ